MDFDRKRTRLRSGLSVGPSRLSGTPGPLKLGGQRVFSLADDFREIAISGRPRERAVLPCEDTAGEYNIANLDHDEAELTDARRQGVSRSRMAAHLGWDQARVARVWRRLSRRYRGQAPTPRGAGVRGGGSSLRPWFRNGRSFELSQLDREFLDVMRREWPQVSETAQQKNVLEKCPRLPNLELISEEHMSYSETVNATINQAASLADYEAACRQRDQIAAKIHEMQEQQRQLAARLHELRCEKVGALSAVQQRTENVPPLIDRLADLGRDIRLYEAAYTEAARLTDLAHERLEAEVVATVRTTIHEPLVRRAIAAMKEVAEAFCQEQRLIAALQGARIGGIQPVALGGGWDVADPNSRIYAWLDFVASNGYKSLVDQTADRKKGRAA